jgi:hypothetical protein
MTKTQDKFTIERVGFRADGNVELRGNLYIPATGDGPYPALTLSMGYGGVKEQCAVAYAGSLWQRRLRRALPRPINHLSVYDCALIPDTWQRCRPQDHDPGDC